MMLPTDMALLWDKKYKQWVDLYAKDEETFFKVGRLAYHVAHVLGYLCL